MQPAPVTTAPQQRALDAALELVGQQGVGATSLGLVARHAAISRATLYRAFPGGRDQLFVQLGQREVSAILAAVGTAIDQADDLEAAVAGALHTAAQRVQSHAALRYVLAHEPHLAVPFLGFTEMDRLLRVVRRALAPRLARFLDDGAAEWAAEWVARLFLSTLVNPTAEFDLSDRAVCDRLVQRYVGPAFVTSRLTATTDLVPTA